MKAVFLADRKKDLNKGFNLVVVNLDKHSLSHLVRGEPVTIGFYTDNDHHLPQYNRGIMKVIIGTQDDLIKKYEAAFEERKSAEGMVDKSYLFAAMSEIKDKIFSLLSRELGMNITIEPVDRGIFNHRDQYELFTMN